MLGVALGFPVMFFTLAYGLGAVFERWPEIHEIMRYVGAAYLLFLAWRIANAGRASEVKGRGRPLNFWEAAAFQWINPKGVFYAISVVAAFTGGAEDFQARVWFLTMVLILVSYSSISTWCLFGAGIGRILRSELHLRIFNISMALLLAGSVAFLFMQ